MTLLRQIPCFKLMVKSYFAQIRSLCNFINDSLFLPARRDLSFLDLQLSRPSSTLRVISYSCQVTKDKANYCTCKCKTLKKKEGSTKFSHLLSSKSCARVELLSSLVCLSLKIGWYYPVNH